MKAFQTGTVTQVLVGAGAVKTPVMAGEVGWDGFVGDRHATPTRRAMAREAHFAKGVEIRNLRAVTLVSTEELAEIAAAMGVARLEAAWLGANLCVAGISGLTQIPAGSLLMFDGGVSLMVTGENDPCRKPVPLIAQGLGIAEAEARGFVKAAYGRRGLLALVVKRGTIGAGEGVRVLVP